MPTQRRVLRTVWPSLAVGFVALAVSVAVAGSAPGDGRVLAGAVGLADDRWLGPARLVDRATSNLPLAVASALVVVLLVRLGRRRDGVLVAVSVGGALVGNPLLKRLVDRPRPELLAPLEGASALSFPSGHAAGTAALAVAVVVIASAHRWAAPVVAAAAVLVLITAAAQLVLARHHPSDILGGWLWASAWTLAAWDVLTRPPRRRAG